MYYENRGVVAVPTAAYVLDNIGYARGFFLMNFDRNMREKHQNIFQQVEQESLSALDRASQNHTSSMGESPLFLLLANTYTADTQKETSHEDQTDFVCQNHHFHGKPHLHGSFLFNFLGVRQIG